MNEASEHILDPVPDEDFAQWREAADGKPAGVRFLAFNTVVDLEAYGSPEICRAAFTEAQALCRTYERLFSRTLPHSDIARINSANGAAVAIDPLTYELLSKALDYCAASNGVFDITIGPAIRLWDFHNNVAANPLDLAKAIHHVDWHKLELWEKPATENRKNGGICQSSAAHGTIDNAADDAVDGIASEAQSAHDDSARAVIVRHDNPPERTGQCNDVVHFARLVDPQAAVDVGGIAKGWIADALIDVLKGFDLPGIIVNLGGNVAVCGTKPNGQPWGVGIRDPRDPARLLGAVPLANGSAVTSGIYERCFTAPDGAFYHHVLNPNTGMPVVTDVAGVTVICEKSIDAEGFSTTLLALGTDCGCDFVQRHPEILQAFFVASDGSIVNAR